MAEAHIDDVPKKSGEDGIFLRDLGLGKIISLFFSYLVDILRYIARKPRSRFVPLTPGFLANQFVYDRMRGNTFRIRLRNGIDWIIFDQIFLSEDYATHRFARHYEALAYYRQATNSGKIPLILDCGGHVGLAAVYFSQTFPEAQVVSVEPNPGNYRQAVMNTAGRRVAVINAAVASSPGRGTFLDPGFGSVAHRVKVDDSGEVPLVSIHDILEKYPYQKFFPTVIKVDIEGFEADLFSANTAWLKDFPLLIIELHDWMLIGSANSQNFLKVIAESGRDFAYFGENVFSFRNPRKPSKRDLEGKTP